MAKSTKKNAKPAAPRKRTGKATLKAAPLRVDRADFIAGASPAVLDRLWTVVMQRRNANPDLSHSARLLSRGTAKVAQKFGEEAVECLIEAVAGNRAALIGESADVLYHLIVLWVAGGIEPVDVWAELERREGVSGIVEKASRPSASVVRTRKIP